MSNSTLPNPDTFLNHLPPDEANQYELVKNICVAILGISIWDVLIYLPEDIKIVYSNLGIVTFCFVFSRLFAIAYAVLFVIMLTTSVSNCEGIGIATASSCLLAMVFTSFLFLRRLQAVYSEQRKVNWLFGFLWFGSSVVTALGPVGLGAYHVDGHCVVYETRDQTYSAITRFLPAVFDAVVFIAISYKVISGYVDIKSSGVTWRSFFSGKLPPISRELLRGGQQYYMIVCASTIAFGAAIYIPIIPGVYVSMSQLVAEVLAASMACRVYRNLKMLDLSAQASHDNIPAVSGLRFAGNRSQTRATQPQSPERRSSHPVVSALPITNSIVTVPANAHTTTSQY